MLPLINPAPFLWFFLIAAAALLAGSVIFFLGILKGKEIEAKLQRRSQKLSRSILGGVFSEQVAPFLPDFPKELKASEARFIGAFAELERSIARPARSCRDAATDRDRRGASDAPRQIREDFWNLAAST